MSRSIRTTASLWSRVRSKQKELFMHSFKHVSASRNYCIVCKNNKPRCFLEENKMWQTAEKDYFIATTCSNECYEYIKLVVC